MTILVADDNAVSRELIRELLEASGHVVLDAINGADTLDVIRRRAPDLVFLDLQMPVQDGFGVIRELRNEWSLSETARSCRHRRAMIGDRERAIAAGFDSYIAKPIDLGEVELQVEAFGSGPTADSCRQQTG